MLVYVFALVLGYLSWYYLTIRLPKSFPPGPRRAVPILGHALSLGKNFIQGIHTLYERYGDIAGLYIGSRKAVVIYKYELIQEAYSRDSFSGRRGGPLSLLVRGGASINEETPGVLMAHGQTWREQRRFALSTLRDFGYGKVNMENMIEEEVSDLLNYMEKELTGKPIGCQNLFNISTLNSLWTILTGERLSRLDPKARKLIQLVHELLVEQTKPKNSLIFNSYWLTVTLNYFGMVGLISTFHKILNFIQPTIKQHRDTYQPDSMRDFIDAYFLEQSKAKDGSSFHGQYGDDNLKALFIDFFLAGSETTSTTLTWALLFMANNPDVQSKVQEELDAVIGRNRLASYSDRDRTPYTEAVIHEIQRRANVAAFGVPHKTTRDDQLGDYTIPANTMVMSGLGEVMHNPEDFPDPYKFNPSRYISEDGKFKAHPKVIPFGLGKRRCLGETLAKMSLYKFFTGLMQRFNVERVGKGRIDETPVLTFAQGPKPFEINLILRD